jgi:hypothetical protein
MKASFKGAWAAAAILLAACSHGHEAEPAAGDPVAAAAAGGYAAQASGWPGEAAREVARRKEAAVRPAPVPEKYYPPMAPSYYGLGYYADPLYGTCGYCR